MSIESIEARLEAASPWTDETVSFDLWGVGIDSDPDDTLHGNGHADAELALHAQPDLRLLLDVAKVAEEFCESSWRTGGSIKELVRLRARLSEALDALEAGK